MFLKVISALMYAFRLKTNINFNDTCYCVILWIKMYLLKIKILYGLCTCHAENHSRRFICIYAY